MGRVKPEVRYARNGDVAIAFAVVGDGPVDLVFVAPFGNLEVAWENPLFAQFLRRLATFARVVIIDAPMRDLGPDQRRIVASLRTTMSRSCSMQWALSARRCLDSPTPVRSVRCSLRCIPSACPA
jgi:hypothetical protein